MSDLDLILKILREEIQVDSNVAAGGQTYVDGIPVNTIAPIKKTWESNPNSRGGIKKLVTKREVSEPYKRRYKINNSTGEIVPYTPEEQRNRRKGAVLPDLNSDYAKYGKSVLNKTPTGSHNNQAMKSRNSLQDQKSREKRDVERAKNRHQINNAKSSL